VSRVALAATVADGDVDHHTGDGDGDGWRERGYREQQSVVGEDLDVGVVDHACTVGLGSTSLAVGSRLFSLPAPHESAPMRISVHASTTRQPNGPQDFRCVRIAFALQDGDLLDERSGRRSEPAVTTNATADIPITWSSAAPPPSPPWATTETVPLSCVKTLCHAHPLSVVGPN
jgi:hypothetical protein